MDHQPMKFSTFPKLSNPSIRKKVLRHLHRKTFLKIRYDLTRTVTNILAVMSFRLLLCNSRYKPEGSFSDQNPVPS